MTLTSSALLTQRTQVTNASGEFRFAGVPVGGSYTVECSLEGFAVVVQTDVTVPGAGQYASLDIQLPLVTIEDVSETFEHVAEPATPAKVPPRRPSPPSSMPDLARVDPIDIERPPETSDSDAEEKLPSAEDEAAESSEGADEEPHKAEAGTSLDPPSESSKSLQKMLDEADFAFNHPQRVDSASEFFVEAAASFVGIEEEVLAALAELGDLAIEKIELSTRVEVKLSSAKFDIVPITPEEQLVEPDSTTRWRWSLTARESGRHRLHLTVIAYRDSTQPDLPKAIKTYERVIEVSVSPGRASLGFLTTNWQWLTTVVLIPLGAYFWRWRQRRRPEELNLVEVKAVTAPLRSYGHSSTRRPPV